MPIEQRIHEIYEHANFTSKVNASAKFAFAPFPSATSLANETLLAKERSMPRTGWIAMPTPPPTAPTPVPTPGVKLKDFCRLVPSSPLCTVQPTHYPTRVPTQVPTPVSTSEYCTATCPPGTGGPCQSFVDHLNRCTDKVQGRCPVGFIPCDTPPLRTPAPSPVTLNVFCKDKPDLPICQKTRRLRDNRP